MDLEKSPLPAIEPVSKAPQSSEPAPVTPKAGAAAPPPKKAGAKVPEGYKLVKKSNPDGTYKIVLRPIKTAAATGAASASTVPPKDAAQPAKPITGASPSSKTPTKDAEQAPKATPGNASGTTPPASTPKKTAAAAENTVAPPAHTSKLDAVSKSARFYGRFHRFSGHASRFAAAFDPDFGDYEDVDDDEDGDVTVDEGNDSGSESDDSDRDYSDHPNNQPTNQPSSGNRTTGNGAQAIAANIGRIPARTTVAPAVTSKKPEVTVKEKRSSQSSNGLSKETSVQEKELLAIKERLAEEAHIHGPRPLPKRYTDWGRIIVWTMVILFPLTFIGLGIATAKLDGQPATKLQYNYQYTDPDGESDDYFFFQEKSVQTHTGYVISHATKAAITAWPIVFAAILAQTLKAVATYQVERGIRLRTLEQLISSHSVAGALKQPFILRKLNWVTFALLALWALSPLGSQAMQYTTFTRPNIIWDHNTIYYLNTTQENPGLSSNFEAVNNYSDSMDVLYAAVFQQTSQFKPTAADLWGNPLVPIYERLTESVVADTITLKLTKKTDYSSFYGIPLTNIANDDGGLSASWNFTMHSSYLYLSCPELTYNTWANITDELLQLDFHTETFNTTMTGSLFMDMIPPKTAAQPGSLAFISSCSRNHQDNDQDITDDDYMWAYTTCDLSQTFVYSNVSCDNNNCSVITIQKEPEHAPVEMQDFMPEFLKASDTGLSAYPVIGNTSYSITELYLRDKDNATSPGAGNYCDLSAVHADAFTKDLAYLVNTFYSTGFTHDFSAGSIDANETVPILNTTSGKLYPAYLMASALTIQNSTSDVYPTIYGIHRPWLWVYICCAMVLLLIGILGIFVESITIAPDILGFASSVARHSRYVKLPKVDGTMSGAERARLMGDSMVMMQDVKPDAPVGKIVLGTVNPGAHRLTKERSYQ
ncbi:hypothetical protein N431DRAFT_445092 [Stipitochalara longipes BDJ]|nr:hypothetical protein N431DRAFT_445092 [Stipitochalara longipes BDJ]